MHLEMYCWLVVKCIYYHGTDFLYWVEEVCPKATFLLSLPVTSNERRKVALWAVSISISWRMSCHPTNSPRNAVWRLTACFLGCFLSDETDYYRVDNVILFWSQTDFALFQNIWKHAELFELSTYSYFVSLDTKAVSISLTEGFWNNVFVQYLILNLFFKGFPDGIYPS